MTHAVNSTRYSKMILFDYIIKKITLINGLDSKKIC
jgi:hypothetical protein